MSSSPLDCGIDLDRPQTRAPEKPPLDVHPWELTSKLQRIERLLSVQPFAEHRDPASFRIDAAHEERAGRTTAAPIVTRTFPNKQADAPPRSAATTWMLLLGLGMLSLSGCMGVVLWAWATQVQLSAPSILVPFLVAQLAIFTGMALLAVRLRAAMQTVRKEAASIRRQLRALERSTTTTGISQPGSARSFYAHLAQGASPHLLLADIRGQVDQLTMQLLQQD